LLHESLRNAAAALATATQSVEYALEQFRLSACKDKGHKWSMQAVKGSSTEPSSEAPTVIASGSSSSS
jgi:hypothetical protein